MDGHAARERSLPRRPHRGDRVLDLGSAAGAMAHYLSTFGCEAVGVDSSELGVEYARARYPDLRFETADVAALPFADEAFDKVVAADLTEHLDAQTLRDMLAECRRVLVAGGRSPSTRRTPVT